ncbi:hypothetical protein [Streptomyces griseus]|uniref:hypothetical protein n=1 Tax=Streptomyces griseus TaxID=1911 RepID=UPI0008404D22|nr:hypothetical protein [Streptomyces griseus]
MSNFFNRAWSRHRRKTSSAARPARGPVPRAAVLTSACAATLVLAACGGGADEAKDDGRVASISRPSADGGGAAPRSGDGSDAGRPQIRLDTTSEEMGRMYDAWIACMKKNGMRNKGEDKPDSPWVVKCQGKEPLQPAELDPARNPDFMDDSRAMVQCMNKHGFESVLVDEGWGLKDGASMNKPGYETFKTDCQTEAFGGK